MKRLAGIPLLILVLAWVNAGTAAADTLRPTRFDDPPPGKCKPRDCSLREAVVEANAENDADTIRLRDGRYRLSIADGSFDGAETGELGIYAAAKVIGEGPGKTVVDGTGVDGVFGLIGLSPHTLRGMTIRGGVAKDGSGDPADGGGVYLSYPKATLDRVEIRENSARNGGGVYSVSGNLTIKRSVIRANDASQYGGGLFSPGAIVPPVAKLRASTVSGNSAAVGGGAGVDGFDPGNFLFEPVLDLLNTTVANNDAAVSGGGISAIQNATVILDNSTIAYNGADVDNSGGGNGGGLYQSTDADFQIRDIVLADNTVGSTGAGPQCAGSFTGGALIAGGAAACSIAGTFVADAGIGPLATNGGPTKTIALLSGSPAIDRPNPFDCPARDQRGRNRDDACDTGAFERKPNDP